MPTVNCDFGAVTTANFQPIMEFDQGNKKTCAAYPPCVHAHLKLRLVQDDVNTCE